MNTQFRVYSNKEQRFVTFHLQEFLDIYNYNLDTIQFNTALKDNYGNEVFENSLLSTYHNEEILSEEKAIYIVKYQDGAFCVQRMGEDTCFSLAHDLIKDFDAKVLTRINVMDGEIKAKKE